MTDAALNAPASSASSSNSSSKRNSLLLGLGAVVVVGALGYGAYWELIGSHYVETDDAYVDASSAVITPLISAAVTKSLVNDTQRVKANDVLLTLDDTDARLALDQAQANLGQVILKVKGYYATDDAMAAQTAARQAAFESAKSDLDRASTDLQRRKALAASGAVSGDELTSAENRLRNAQAALEAAKAQVQSAQSQRAVNQALISGGAIGDSPEVKAAQAMVDQAKVNLDRTVIRAPIDGVIAKNNVEVGQRVQVGQALMSVVPIDQAYVNANFKEVQLRDVHPGQPVELKADIDGGHFVYHGKVVGLGAGTGAAFSLIPAQNATGNWIKVVQRLPVRIALDPAEVKAHPLRVGMSMSAKIHTL